MSTQQNNNVNADIHEIKMAWHNEHVCGGQGMLSWIAGLDIIMEAPIFGLSQEISISYFIWSFVEQNVWVLKLELEFYYLMWNLGLCFKVLKCWLQSFTSRLTAWKYRGVDEVCGAPSSISHIIQYDNTNPCNQRTPEFCAAWGSRCSLRLFKHACPWQVQHTMSDHPKREFPFNTFLDSMVGLLVY
jgi:hypothetical protein